MKNTINKPVLLLNASYEPVAIQAARDILKKMAKDKLIVEEEYDFEIAPGINVPCVVRLKVMVDIPIRLLVTTRDNIYARDKYTCQYCGRKMSAKSLTLDHVIPRSKGGSSKWENLVACCKPCNTRKDDKTPEEVGMWLLNKPKSLTSHSARHLLRLQGMTEDERWRKYIYA